MGEESVTSSVQSNSHSSGSDIRERRQAGLEAIVKMLEERPCDVQEICCAVVQQIALCLIEINTADPFRWGRQAISELDSNVWGLRELHKTLLEIKREDRRVLIDVESAQFQAGLDFFIKLFKTIMIRNHYSDETIRNLGQQMRDEYMDTLPQLKSAIAEAAESQEVWKC